MDGIQVCKKIRQSSNRPVIMLTARDEVSDKIQGLEIGADDYITKPFDSNELLARIKAVLRRYHSEQNATSNQEIRYNNLYINTSTMQVEIKNKPTTMTRKEFEILLFLVKNPNKVFNRDQMLNEIWGLECYVDTRTVDVHINRLRAKLENASTEWELRTIWGVGYKFEVHKNDA